MSLRIRQPDVQISPASAGWQFTGLRIVRIPAGGDQLIATEDSEVFVLPLAGALSVEISDASGTVEMTYELAGRTSVFTAVSDFAYAGRDSRLRLTSEAGAEVAIPSARCAARLAPAYGPADAVPVEVRGAGLATRQVTNFGVPGVWPHAERLIACEVITPPGNWSSYPPHKHDVTSTEGAVDEEIYYYRLAGADRITPSPQALGWHRTYTGPEHATAGLPPLDESFEVRDGDVVLVPHGYHGPCAAAPGYPMYYLNVMAGPGAERSMAFCDDPAHAWLRDSWRHQDLDPRCPVTGAGGRADGLGGAR